MTRLRQWRHKIPWWIGIAGFATAVAGASLGDRSLLTMATLVALAGIACGFMGSPKLRSYSFTAWVFVFVAAAMFYPAAFGTWLGVDLKILIVPLIQLIMFGMGTTLSVGDFTRVLTTPWPIFVGMLLQFSVMPGIGYLLATCFGAEPEVAAGIVLIGACPGGVASNVMTYLARGNVPLSVTMTACSTLMSPILTPLFMELLASQYLDIRFSAMVIDICNMIIVPLVAGLLANYILYSDRHASRHDGALAGLVLACTALAGLVWFLNAPWLGAVKSGVLVGLVLLALSVVLRWILAWLAGDPRKWVDRALPLISMGAICYIIAIITARSAEDLLRVGPMLIGAAMIHNTLGYLLGYWGAQLLRLNETDCRTVAIEVGLQNGGMASGLAMNTLHSAKAALAPAIFGPWMNISGSVLATWWRGRSSGTVVDSVAAEQPD